MQSERSHVIVKICLFSVVTLGVTAALCLLEVCVGW